MYHLSTFTPSHLVDDLDEIIREKLEEGIECCCVVLTESMRYMIRPGSSILIEAVGVESLRKKDIVVFRSEGGYVAHRLVSVDFGSGSITTRGDLCDADDSPVMFSAYRGRVRVIRNGPDSIVRTDFSWHVRSIKSIMHSRLLRALLGIRRRVQNLVFRGRELPAVRQTIYGLSRLGVFLTTIALRRAALAECVFARRSFAINEWVPGLSDVDLGIVSNHTDRWKRSISLLSFIQKVIPFIGEVWIGTADDLEFCRQHEYRQLEVPSWKALLGVLPQPCEDTAGMHPFKIRLDCLKELREALRYFCSSVIRFQWSAPLEEIARLTLRKHLLNALIALYYLEKPPSISEEFLAGREKFLRFLCASRASPQLICIGNSIDERTSGPDTSIADFCDCYQQLHGYFQKLSPGLAAFFSSEGVEFHQSSLLLSLDRTWVPFSDKASGAELLERLARDGKDLTAQTGHVPYLLCEAAFRLIAVDTLLSFASYFRGDHRNDLVRWLWFARLAADALALANRLHSDCSRTVKADCLTVWSEFQYLGWVLLTLNTVSARNDSEAFQSVPFSLPEPHRECFHILMGEDSPGEQSLQHIFSQGHAFSGALADAFRRAGRYATDHLCRIKICGQSSAALKVGHG